jgi:hypothetical protein
VVARVATFEGINLEAAEQTMEQAEAIIRPMVESLNGYQRRLDLVSGDCKYISITFFDTEENAKASEPTFDEEMPRKLGEIFGSWEGRRVSRDLYDVVSDART